MELEFVDPPEKKRQSWNEFIDELKKNPNRWVVWRRNSWHQMGTLLRKKYPQVEVRLVKTGKNDKGASTYDIYVIWKEESNAELDV